MNSKWQWCSYLEFDISRIWLFWREKKKNSTNLIIQLLLKYENESWGDIWFMNYLHFPVNLIHWILKNNLLWTYVPSKNIQTGIYNWLILDRYKKLTKFQSYSTFHFLLFLSSNYIINISHHTFYIFLFK